jgi:hypothetical protein
MILSLVLKTIEIQMAATSAGLWFRTLFAHSLDLNSGRVAQTRRFSQKVMEKPYAPELLT